MVQKEDIPFLSAGEMARLIEKREISPVEATEAYLERIDSLDFKFNSYLTVCCSDALRAATKAERAIVRGNYLGPMHGIPVAVKDQFWTKGIRSTGGSRILAGFLPGWSPASTGSGCSRSTKTLNSAACRAPLATGPAGSCCGET